MSTCAEAASAAHIYGKPLVATESYTGGGYESPFTLKKIADYWFAQGVNRLVFHTSAEQPLDTKPGNTMVGTHINRNITWAELAKPFMTLCGAHILHAATRISGGGSCLSVARRCAFDDALLGRRPATGAAPLATTFDMMNTDVLLHRTSVAADGRIHVAGSDAMPEGMSYRLLVLPPSTQMTPEVLHKLHDLVAAGATIRWPTARPLAEPVALPRRPTPKFNRSPPICGATWTA